MLKKMVLLILLTLQPCIFPNETNPPLSFAIENIAVEHDKIKCQLLLLSDNKILVSLGKIVKSDLEFTDQLDVDLKKTNAQLDEKTENKLFDQGTSLLLYLNDSGNEKFKLNLKDIGSGTSVFEKEFVFSKSNKQLTKKQIVYLAHKISDELLPILTGEKGISLHSLAYCKMLSPRHKTICVADYACKVEQTVVKAKTVNISPSWHTKVPMIFYSQFTKFNNRLMSIDLKTQKHKIVCSYDGLNMQPSFSKDGSRAVLCLSGGKNSELYLYDQRLCNKMQKRAFVKLTNNKGNNISPSLLPNGNIIFCSDFESGLPQIYHLDRKRNITNRLTSGNGYCAAPSYCASSNNIVYTRAINGTFQLFSLNLNDLEEKQLTFGYGNKHEPAYSDCGRFIAFSMDHEYKKGHKTQQIAILNYNSGKIRLITTGKHPKSFPAWSNQPLYLQ